jgi:hypothetical protein
MSFKEILFIEKNPKLDIFQQKILEEKKRYFHRISKSIFNDKIDIILISITLFLLLLKFSF